MDKQLNIWIPADLKEYVEELAKQKRKGQNTIVAELIQEHLAHQRGEVIEQQSLPVMREMVQTELRNVFAQQRIDLREDMHVEIVDAISDQLQRYVRQLGKLVTRTVRDGGIIRHLIFTSLSKTYGTDFAKRTYDDAKERVSQDLTRPRTKGREDE